MQPLLPLNQSLSHWSGSAYLQRKVRGSNPRKLTRGERRSNRQQLLNCISSNGRTHPRYFVWSV